MDTLGMPWPATDTTTLTTSDWGLNNTHNSRQVGSKNTKITWGRASDWCPTPKNKRHPFDLGAPKSLLLLNMSEWVSARARRPRKHEKNTTEYQQKSKIPKIFPLQTPPQDWIIRAAADVPTATMDDDKWKQVVNSARIYAEVVRPQEQIARKVLIYFIAALHLFTLWLCSHDWRRSVWYQGCRHMSSFCYFANSR